MTEEEAEMWTGFWMTGGEDKGEMAVTSGSDGTLHMKVFFLRTFDLEADLKRTDSSRCSFETAYGHYTGTLTRNEDGTLLFAITGGMSMEDDENELYYFFRDQEYAFRKADYYELWYELPAEEPEDDADWEGEWNAGEGDLTSRLRIIRGAQGSCVLQLSFSTGFVITGPLEQTDSRTMDFYTDSFSAMLTLNRKKHAILMSEIGSTSDDVYRWLDDAGSVIEYRGTQAGSGNPGSETAQPPDSVPDAAAEQPKDPAGNEANLVPIPGNPDFMQVQAAQASATSYIVGKDPDAYTPYRMIDGDENTAFQFSTKTTKLGKEYLYFEFDCPSVMDEL